MQEITMIRAGQIFKMMKYLSSRGYSIFHTSVENGYDLFRLLDKKGTIVAEIKAEFKTGKHYYMEF